MKKTLAQKRSEDAIFYNQCAEFAFFKANQPGITLEEAEEYYKAYKRAIKALEISKLDPIAAHRVFTGIAL